MKKEVKENILNISNLAFVWFVWLGWMLWSPHHLPLILAGLISIVINLSFLQAISGVVHEAAHLHFIQGNKQLNEFIGNWFAAHLFLYGLGSYRDGHFAHHRTKLFFIPEDGETAPNMSEKVDLRGFFVDLCGITAVKMFFFRTSKNAGLNAEPNAKSDSSWLRIIMHFLILWSFVAYFGSPIMFISFIFTMVTIYPFSNRIRLWGTHADIVNENGLLQSAVARNVLSPIWERIFFGNRMMMYHYEHHLKPQLSFRECEKEALARTTNDLNVSAPSYFFCIKQILKTNRVSRLASSPEG